MGYLGAIPFALKNALLIVINTKPGKDAGFCVPQHVYRFTGNQTLHIGAIGSSGQCRGIPLKVKFTLKTPGITSGAEC